MAAIALHVFDDTLVNPERGTNLGDHLTSALALLALLILAAASSPVLRAGSLAALALAIGAYGTAVGFDAFSSISNGVVGGDDRTGLVAAAAGIGLIGLGANILWTTRRRDGRWFSRLARRSGYALGAMAFAAGFVAPLVSSYAATH